MAAAAVAAGIPSLAMGIFGGGFLTDDWSVWYVLDRMGVADGLWRLAFVQPARPLAAPYYAFIYLVIGDSPVVQSLVLAAINVLVVVAAWACGRRFLSPHVLLPALVVLSIAPNHAMTRLWFVVGTYPLALALVFLGVREVDRRRRVPAAVLLLAATLLYEGVVVLALALVALWTLRDVPGRLREAAAVVAPTVVVACIAFLRSPKRGGSGPDPFDHAGTFLPGQLGTGLWDVPTVARVFGGLLLLCLAGALVVQLPSWKTSRPEPRLVLVGIALSVLGAAPYFVSGSIFGTTGLFDRNNLVPGVGVALSLGALWALLDSRSRPTAAVVAVVAMAWFTTMQVEDVIHYVDAVQRGEDVIDALAAAPGVDDSRLILVVPAQEAAGTGLADFVYDGDLIAAMRYRHRGDWTGVRLVENARCSELADVAGPLQVFDWTTGRIALVPHAVVAQRCETEKSASRAG